MERGRRALVRTLVGEALTHSNMTLLDLKRIAARRVPQVMAVALGKGWNNADVRFRTSPSGPTEQPALVVTPSHQAVSMLSKVFSDNYDGRLATTILSG